MNQPKVTTQQFVRLHYACACGFRVVLTKHRSLYEQEKRANKIDRKKICEQCNNKIMKLTERVFNG